MFRSQARRHKIRGRRGASYGCILSAFAIAAFASIPSAYGDNSPVVPGYERLSMAAAAGSEQALDVTARGELLLGELNCLSCHGASSAVQERVPTKTAPDLSNVGSRVSPQYLMEYLSDPHGVKPGATMPDIFHASEARPKAGAVEFLTQYLVSLGGPLEVGKQSGTAAIAEKGARLFHSVGCVACHAPQDKEGLEINTPVVPLGNLAKKTTLSALTEFLLDPLKTRHSGRMPNLWLKEDEAEAISTYLLRDQMEVAISTNAGPAETPGIAWEYHEIASASKLDDFSGSTPVSKGVSESFTIQIPGKRGSNYGIRWIGSLEVPQEGNYRFFLSSDDGSSLKIDGEQIILNDGIHPANTVNGRIALSAGSHQIEAWYFQGGGEEVFRLEWAGPGMGRREIDGSFLTATAGIPMQPIGWQAFTPDVEKAAMGKRMFAMMRCVSCHEMPGLRPLFPAKSLVELNTANDEGCLGASVRRGLPQYHLDADQKEALGAAVKHLQGRPKEISQKEKLQRQLATLNCYACHNRDGIGGPDEARSDYFQSLVEIDLGDEGRIPPTLTGVGAKLKAEALKDLLQHGDHHVRGRYMATRMPGFGAANVSTLAEHLTEVDAWEGLTEEPPFSEENVEIGKKFVGVTGVACVICHGVAGQKGLGIEGIDLSTAYARLNPGWFEKFLANPGAFNKDTRMPAFWPEGQSSFPDILEGSAERQIQSIWSYLSLGKTMSFPAGIEPTEGAKMELKPTNEPITHRTFMKDVGPRTILTGFPERLHVAFDANNVRLAKAWRGRFFDASGVASGRTDAFLEPLGIDVIDMPSGPAFAFLENLDAPWPIAGKMDRDVGGDFKGYRLDEGMRPTFVYNLKGVTIEEDPLPRVQPGGAALQRSFYLKSENSPAGLYFVVAEDTELEILDDGVVRTASGSRVSVVTSDGRPLLKLVLRDSNGMRQALLPIEWSAQGDMRFQSKLIW